MSPENAIEVTHVSKRFKIYKDRGTTLKEKALFAKRREYENRVVLKDISFQVKKGEAIGLVGHNGCGKSTMLKLLTRIMYPDSGMIEMQGRVSSLIELGAGFHPDMSGRDNIYINASIFGLTKKEIDERLETIIEFSELRDFIDNPVRTYSSGMYTRLAFSVAINVNADILLIDEILAVGDVSFQNKCFNKLREIKAAGTTIVIVSHALSQIEQICERSVWINNGLVAAEGRPRDVHPMYMDFMGSNRLSKKASSAAPAAPKTRWGSGKAHFTEVWISDMDGRKRTQFRCGETVFLKMKYEVREYVEDAVFGIGIFRSDGLQCYGTNTRIDKIDKFDLKVDGELEITLDSMTLLIGKYTLDIAIEQYQGIPVDYYRQAISFEIYSDIRDVGVSRIEHKWKI